MTHLAFIQLKEGRRPLRLAIDVLTFAVEQGPSKGKSSCYELNKFKPDPQKDEHTSDDTIRYLSEAQLKCLYRAVELDTRMKAIISLLHRSGARLSQKCCS